MIKAIVLILTVLSSQSSNAERYYNYLDDNYANMRAAYIDDIDQLSLVFANTPDECELNMPFGAPLLSDGTMLLPASCTPTFSNIVIPKIIPSRYSNETLKFAGIHENTLTENRNLNKTGSVDANSKGLPAPNGKYELIAISSSSVPFYQHNYQTLNKKLFDEISLSTFKESELSIQPFVSPVAYSLAPSDIFQERNGVQEYKLEVVGKKAKNDQLPMYFLSLPRRLASKAKGMDSRSIIDPYHPAKQLTQAFIAMQNTAWQKALHTQKDGYRSAADYYTNAPQVITSSLSRKYVGYEFQYILVVNFLNPVKGENQYFSYTTKSNFDAIRSKNPKAYVFYEEDIERIEETDYLELTGVLLNPLLNRRAI